MLSSGPTIGKRIVISLLRAMAFDWRQEQIARNAQEISALGHRLYGHFGAVTMELPELRPVARLLTG
jgi:DNA anti-recombination protein RmuC